MNRYYADFMSEFLAVPRDRIHIIRPGLNLQGHGVPGASCPPVNRPFTIGYLSRICPDKGLHLLVDAWKLLAVDGELPPVRLRVAGYLDPADRPYLDELLFQAASSGLGDRFECLGELDRPGKIAFLQSLDLLSVPTVCRESKGVPILEAWANGVPAVLPDHGAFPGDGRGHGRGFAVHTRRRGFVGGGGQTHDSRPAICRRMRPPRRKPYTGAIMHNGWPRKPWTCTGSCLPEPPLRDHFASSSGDGTDCRNRPPLSYQPYFVKRHHKRSTRKPSQ